MNARRCPSAALLSLGLLSAGVSCSHRAPGPPGISAGPARKRGDGGSQTGSASERSPRPDGGAILPAADEEVVLPFGGPEQRRRITLTADPGVLDVCFSVDTTASIGQEIDQLQQDLASSVVPELKSRVDDVRFGVAKFEDFPRPPFGSPGSTANGRPADTPFVLLSPITSDQDAVESAVARLDQPLGEGGDTPEAGAEALWQIATGKGYVLDGETLIAPYDGRPAPGGGSAGGVGFRAGALRVVLHITDAPSHQPEDYGDVFPGTHTLAQAGMALHELGAKLVGIVSGACNAASSRGECDDAMHAKARADLEQVALLTGALGAAPTEGTCPTGLQGDPVPSSGDACPLVFDVDAQGGGLSTTLVDAIVGLVDGIRFESVSGYADDDPLGFVRRVEPLQLAQDATADAPMIADLLPADAPDGEPDSFVQVPSRAALAFDVVLQNRHIAATDVDQTFRAVVQIEGDGLILVQRTLRIRVPAGSALAPASDADGGS